MYDMNDVHGPNDAQNSVAYAVMGVLGRVFYFFQLLTTYVVCFGPKAAHR